MLHYQNEEDKKNKNYMKAEVKLIDFGLARHLKVGEWATSAVGTPAYEDPMILKKALENEKFRNKTPFGYDEKIDIWSLGILCYELLVGSWTFNANDQNELLEMVQKGEFKLPATISKETLLFVNSMLKYKFEERPSAEELANSPFLMKNVKDFNSVNLEKAKSKISGGGFRLSTKKLASVFNTVFDESELKSTQTGDLSNIPEEPAEIDQEDIKKEFAEDFEFLNKYCMPMKSQFYPVIPGTSPDLFKKFL